MLTAMAAGAAASGTALAVLNRAANEFDVSPLRIVQYSLSFTTRAAVEVAIEVVGQVAGALQNVNSDNCHGAAVL